jgi:peptide/nickel transport system permease protein
MLKFLKKNKYTASGSLSKLAWHRFSKNKLAMSALLFILLTLIVGILGYLIIPDKTPFANDQALELATKKPGFETLTLRRFINRDIEQHNFIYSMLFGQEKLYQEIPIVDYKLSDDSIIVEEYTGMTPNDGQQFKYHLADVLYPLSNENAIIKKANDEFEIHLVDGKHITIYKADLLSKVKKNSIVKRKYLLGTDRFGRDYLSQLIIGSRVSLSVGFIAVLISLLVGISLGATAAYFGGWLDQLIVWFINVIWSIPTLLLVIAITMALGKGYWQVFIAVGLTMWVEVARVVRGQVLSIRQKEFVEASVALGFTNYRIIFKHILPNVVSPLIVISAANFASAILIEAGLSFLGIGVQPPTPSWGIMIKEHYGYIILDYAYLAILPGLAIMLMVLAFMIVGNGLRDALDVKVVKS